MTRLRVVARVALLAASLAVLGFGATTFGIFGPVHVMNAILETTSQSPVSVLPRPSPGIVATGSSTSARTADEAPLLAVLFVAGVGGALLAIRSGKAMFRRRTKQA